MTLAVAGCATYHPQPITAAYTASRLDSRSLDDPRLDTFIVAVLGSGGGSETRSTWNLARLTLAALYFRPDLDVARARLASARAGVITAGQVPNPSLDLGLTYNATTTTPSPLTTGPIVNFLLETFGKRQYRTAQAEHMTAAARDALATAVWQVRSEVRTALLNLWAVEQRLRANRQRLDLQDQLVRLLEHRFAAGEASSLDVTRERVQRNQISLAVREDEVQAAADRVQLATAIGIPTTALKDVELSFDAFDQPAQPSDNTTSALRREALLHRSDVQGLLAEYAAAQSALQLAVADQFPNLSLGPGYEYDQGDNKYSLSLSAALPIFNQNQGPIAEAEAHRQDVAGRFTALQARIIGQIDSAATRYGAESEALTTADTLLADARDREQQVIRSFEAGAVDRPSLVTSRLERTAAELSRLDVVVHQRQALGALEDALQHPFFEPGVRPFVPTSNPRIAPEPPS
jgi:cobalt-zinc-cadmium efflux system outer membrane protein